MQQPPQTPLEPVARTFAAPSFYLTGRQRIGPGAILLAILSAAGAAGLIAYAMGRPGHGRLPVGSNTGSARSSGDASAAADDDDPNQIDTIVLADPADAPMPGRKGDHVSPVHPTIVVRLPRYGDQTGMIPDTPAGRLLYAWLAAFNQANAAGLANALPSAASGSAAAAQMALRHQTGGFSLLSAKEVQPGVLVFRMRDQTPTGTEVLGTLQVRPDSNPPAIATFSLRAVPAPSATNAKA